MKCFHNILVVFFVCIYAMFIHNTDVYAQDIFISSPQNGDVVVPGSEIDLIINVADISTLEPDIVGVSGVGFFSLSLGENKFSIRVPNTDLDPISIIVTALNKNTQKVIIADEIQLKVNAPSSISSIRFNDQNISFNYVGQSNYFKLLEDSSDLFPIELTGVANVLYTIADPSVVQLDSNKLTALKQGKTSMTATLNGMTAQIDLSVTNAKKGDLNNDNIINRSDVVVLRTYIGENTIAPTDQRDLDQNGVIDTQDLNLLAQMCENVDCSDLMSVMPPPPVSIRGDLDSDGDVDRDDLRVLLASRNQPASGANDPKDLDGDGKITALDARKLRNLCTRPRCATQ